MAAIVQLLLTPKHTASFGLVEFGLARSGVRKGCEAGGYRWLWIDWFGGLFSIALLSSFNTSCFKGFLHVPALSSLYPHKDPDR